MVEKKPRPMIDPQVEKPTVPDQAIPLDVAKQADLLNPEINYTELPPAIAPAMTLEDLLKEKNPVERDEINKSVEKLTPITYKYLLLYQNIDSWSDADIAAVEEGIMGKADDLQGQVLYEPSFQQSYIQAMHEIIAEKKVLEENKKARLQKKEERKAGVVEVAGEEVERRSSHPSSETRKLSSATSAGNYFFHIENPIVRTLLNEIVAHIGSKASGTPADTLLSLDEIAKAHKRIASIFEKNGQTGLRADVNMEEVLQAVATGLINFDIEKNPHNSHDEFTEKALAQMGGETK